MRRFAPSLLASFAAAACCLLGGARPASADDLPGPQVGEPAPDFALTTIDGRPVRLAASAAQRGATLGLSLAPWTGQDLPGSVASTIKYRLVVTGTAGAKVVLSESGLPWHWIGSFCSDRVCAPFRTEIVVPAGGVKVVEFQIVPTTPAAQAFTFRIAAHSEGRTVTTGATVAQR